MDYALRFQKLCQLETRRVLLVMGIIVATNFVIQYFELPYGNVLSSLFSDGNAQKLEKSSSSTGGPSSESVMDGNMPPSNNMTFLRNSDANSRLSVMSVNSNMSSVDKGTTETLSKDENPGILQIEPTNSSTNSPTTSNPVVKKLKPEMPLTSVMSISDMNHLLLQSRSSSRSMRPRWSSIRDQELLSAKSEIENAPIVKNDPELYAPLYRNVSMFKRSYELMERILKVYIYREGEKPIFHQPVLNGIYSSEGWFMKLMEVDKKFTVKNPRKAHLFYIPFSSKMLQATLYVPNSHSHKNLIEHLKNYLDMIAAKYPFWNRTGGADHFLAACHDWAPAETRQYMANCIKALCNADVNEGFNIGNDVSLPETYVVSARNPLRGLGGKSPSKRPILAFFAGSMHGYLRPILLKQWENKDPDMKIFGRMGRRTKSKMNYMQHMKSSKYCICPKGYEVNSPRVVEAIFYECVPVIISDNFVPPFFEVLDWESFAVLVPEKDIPNLKNILLSIPEKKYLSMQMRVKKINVLRASCSCPIRVGSDFSGSGLPAQRFLDINAILSYCYYFDMDYALRFQKLCQVETRRVLLVMGIIVATIFVIQYFELPYGNVLSSLFSDGNAQELGKSSSSTGGSSSESVMVGNMTPSNGSNSNSYVVPGLANNAETSHIEKDIEHKNESKGNDRDPKHDFASGKDGGQDRDTDNESSSDKLVDLDKLENVKPPDNGSVLRKAREPDHDFSLEHANKSDNDSSSLNVLKDNSSLTDGRSDTAVASPPLALQPANSSTNTTFLRNSDANSRLPVTSVNSNMSSVNKRTTETLSKDENPGLLQSGPTTSSKNPTPASNPVVKKLRPEMPLTSGMSISDMNHLLLQSRSSSRSMRPRWSSIRDQELLSAKSQIENAPIIKNDRELYAPLYRNVSMFKRSYELMERILKVYIYSEGEKPIFHQPILDGIYASEGWFMKLMEANKKFVVKDPRKAHLFYLPFSSRMLEVTLYVPNSHNHKNLIKHLKNYLDMIAAKYPFWNRTGGADHFLAACHDWAPSETRHDMAKCIRALCNADVNEGFNIGNDVSLPETYVVSARNPLKGLGGKSPSKRPILAFFAGNMHGYLRPILLQHWANKDPDMKIFGPMGHGTKSKLNYMQHMKSSKYCICAKGYEVNSPRVVEAIFYECVPVIISDNFVPPFFEVLDWESFAVFVPEKDIPNLKNILLSIPEKKYHSMQMRVKKVQQHFLWHTKPVKYDIFHMTLHSIWYNRVFQIKPR
ncbi:hypothetical protein HHK36_014168 [Tetracentron sinense]|uniref:Exostosin GT47 domain-containing protein n=1 Tax=Tetracentron sinense TaxID=13715 RepID=A0A834Z5K1_TETSI|nr:hypothetical protein HHK36_014168 [Tetracentron sinense]